MAAARNANSRWEGILHHCSIGGSNPSRVMASLCLSPSTGLLLKPSMNAVLFMGDRVEGTGNRTIERLSRLENVAAILISKLGSSVNAWVIEASKFQGPFACYEAFLSSLGPTGEPSSYCPLGLTASCAISSLLNDCLRKVNTEICHHGEGGSVHQEASGRGDKCFKMQELCPANVICNNQNLPNTVIFGFSKGGVVLNQLLAEIAYVGDHKECQKFVCENSQVCNNLQAKQEKPIQCDGNDKVHNKQQAYLGDFFLSATAHEFLQSTVGIHYVDVGLNSYGAYQTDPNILEGVAKFAALKNSGLLIGFHGTPRQWNDCRRPWISSEKDHCIALLQDSAYLLGNGKLKILEKLYFGDKKPSLQMHFEILEVLDIC
eukprot:c24176_g1_i1 orf=381-1505(-)